MRYWAFILFAIVLIKCGSSQVLLLETNVKLSSPKLTVDSVFFHERANINYEHRLPGSQIEILSQNTNEFEPIHGYGLTTFTSNSMIFKATKADHQSSDPVEVNVFKIQKELIPEKIQCSTKPNPSYSGTGIESLMDGLKSSVDFKSGLWLGYDQDSIEITIQFDETKKLSKLIVSSLQDQNSWIFPASRVNISYDGELIHDWLMCPLEENTPAQFQFQEIDLKQTTVKSLRIVLYPSILPDWHPGAGKNAWLFLDEILFQ